MKFQCDPTHEMVFKVLEQELSIFQIYANNCYYNLKLQKGFTKDVYGPKCEYYTKIDFGIGADFKVFFYRDKLKFVPNFVARTLYYNTFKELEQKVEKICIKHFGVLINPKNPDTYINRGRLKFEQQDYKGAIADFTSAIDIDPENAAAYRFRSDSKIKLEDFKGATADDNKVWEIDPKFSAYDAIKKHCN